MVNLGFKDEPIEDRLTRDFSVTESKYGTKRVDGKTLIQSLRELRKKVGDEEFAKFVEENKIDLPKTIKLK
jgi:hypothetical protein